MIKLLTVKAFQISFGSGEGGSHKYDPVLFYQKHQSVCRRLGRPFAGLFRCAEKDGAWREMGADPPRGGRKDGPYPLCEPQGIPAGSIYRHSLFRSQPLRRQTVDVRNHFLAGRTCALPHLCPASGLENQQKLWKRCTVPHPGNVLSGPLPADPRLWQGAVPGHAGIQDKKRTAAGQDLQRCRGLPGDCRRVPSSGRCGEFSVDPGESSQDPVGRDRKRRDREGRRN